MKYITKGKSCAVPVSWWILEKFCWKDKNSLKVGTAKTPSATCNIQLCSNHGRNVRDKGAQFPGRRITAEGNQKSQQCHKYFLQCNTFASKRSQVPTWGRQTCFLPRAPSNLATRGQQLKVLCGPVEDFVVAYAQYNEYNDNLFLFW